MVVENTITKCLAMKSVLGVDYIKLEKTTNSDITLPSTLYIGENF